MTESIRLSVTHGDDETALLTVEFVSGKFSGVGSAYFDKKYLDEIARELRTYPLPNNPVVLAGGVFGDTDFDELLEAHVFIQARASAVAPVVLSVRVSEPWDGNGKLRKSASTEFFIDYEQLASLSRKIQMLAQKQREEVFLELNPHW